MECRVCHGEDRVPHANPNGQNIYLNENEKLVKHWFRYSCIVSEKSVYNSSKFLWSISSTPSIQSICPLHQRIQWFRSVWRLWQTFLSLAKQCRRSQGRRLYKQSRWRRGENWRHCLGVCSIQWSESWKCIRTWRGCAWEHRRPAIEAKEIWIIKHTFFVETETYQSINPIQQFLFFDNILKFIVSWSTADISTWCYIHRHYRHCWLC